VIFGRKHRRVDPDALNRQTAEVREYLEKEGPRMSAVATFLHNRRGQNGLGEDFDITFYPREAS
jgi:hypothetical protein